MPTTVEKIAAIEAEVSRSRFLHVVTGLYIWQLDLWMVDKTYIILSSCLLLIQMARTQRNKATMSHLGRLKAQLAKLRRELITPKGGGGGSGEGFDVAKTGDARIGFVGERKWCV